MTEKKPMRAELVDDYRIKCQLLLEEVIDAEEAAKLAAAEIAELRAERDRLKAALVKFLTEADNAPKRIISSGIGGQTMEATLQCAGVLVSKWQLGQLEEALGDAS